MVNKSNLPPLLCSICSFTCRSKPTLLRHKNGIHRSTGSQGPQLKKEGHDNKKRPMNNFTCTKCQSTFTSKYKLKKHVDTQHLQEEVDKSESPPRKVAKHTIELLNETIHSEDEKKESESDTDTGVISKSMDKRIKKLIRPKESTNVSTNTDSPKTNQEKELEGLKQVLYGAREVISNLENECDERNQKAEFYEEMSENLVKENENMISKIKQISEEKQNLQILIEMQKWKLNNYTVKYNCEDCGELIIKENEIEEHKTIHRETMQFEEAEITNDIVMNAQPNPQEKSQPNRLKYL